MKPLIILLGSFLICYLILHWVNGWWDYRLAARIAMAVMLLFTAMGHFVFTKGMTMMVPAFIPFKKGMVYFTGIAEIAGAIGLLFNAWFAEAGLLLVMLFMLMLPANVNAAMRHIDYEKASMDGKGPRYLWFRVPLQLFFIAWLWWLILY